MFSKIFKKNINPKVITDKEVNNLVFILENIKGNYSGIINALKDKLLVSKKINPSFGDNWYSYNIDEDIMNKHSNPKIESFEIQNILISNNDDNYKLDLFIIEGNIIAGYKIEPKFEFNSLNIDKVDFRSTIKKTFVNNDTKAIKDKILQEASDEIIKYLDIGNLFLIESLELSLYTIKNDGAGNYLCVDRNLHLYLLNHDPFEINNLEINLRKVSKSILNDMIS